MFAATAVPPQSLHRLELALAEQADKYCLLSALGILPSIPEESRYFPDLQTVTVDLTNLECPSLAHQTGHWGDESILDHQTSNGPQSPQTSSQSALPCQTVFWLQVMTKLIDRTKNLSVTKNSNRCHRFGGPWHQPPTDSFELMPSQPTAGAREQAARIRLALKSVSVCGSAQGNLMTQWSWKNFYNMKPIWV